MRLHLAVVALLVVGAVVGGDRAAAAATPAGVAAAAETLLARLDGAQRAAVLHDIDAPVRRNWSNLPAGPGIVRIFRTSRPGIRMGDLDEDRREAVFAFLRAALSERGYARVRQIVRADEMLGGWFQATLAGWTEDNYWFAIFGTPSAAGAWAWQFGGHHLAVNVTL